MHLKGFGKFRDKTIKLERGLNIIFGPNESGKSTVHKFIEAMFFGFVKPGVKRRILLDEHEKYRPWIGELYEGSIVYETAGGIFRVERNLLKGRESVAVFDDVTGEEITKSFRYDKNRREPLFCRQHLGINQTVYKNTISISQLGSKSDGELAREVGTQLSNMYSSGDVEISVARAEKIIKEYIDDIGTERAYTKEYGKLCRQRDELEDRMHIAVKRMESLREYQYQLKDLEEKMELLEVEHRDIQEKIRCVEDYLLLKRWESIKALKDKERELQGRLAEFEKYKGFDESGSNEVFALEEFIQREKKMLDMLEAKIDDLCGRIKAVAEELDAGGNMELAVENCLELRGLYARFLELVERRDRTVLEIRELDNRLKDIQDSCDNALDERTLLRAEELQDAIDKSGKDPGAQEYYRLRLEKEAAVRGYRRNTNISILSVTALVITVVLGIFMKPLMFAVSPLFLLSGLYGLWKCRLNKSRLSDTDNALAQLEKERISWEHRLNELRYEMEDIFNRCRVSSVYEARAKFREQERLAEKARGMEERIRDKNGALDSDVREIGRIREKILGMLEEAGIDAGEDIRSAHVEEYLNRVEGYRRIKDEFSDLNRQRESLDHDYRQRVTELQEKQARRDELIELSGAAGIEEYRQSVEGYRNYKEVRRQLQETVRLVETKLDGDDYLTLLREVEAITGDGAAAAGEYNKDELARYLSRRGDIKDAQGEVAAAMEKARGSMETLMEGYISPAEIEEELETLKLRLRALDAERSAACIALDLIKEAAAQVHREFAPLLNERVSQVVSVVTGGRYRELKITRDLEIYVVSPDTGRQVRVEALSGGTVDQFYFACRMGIADLLSGDNRLPMILDDSFVQYDMERLENIMGYLMDVSGERQIIIFTCHNREKEVADKLGRGYNYVEL
ncbi:MAG: hypothetical protein HPY66_0656 [Firmicutes bacterium]|nr:hypothetical protein [Bacillota bacterium]